MCQVGEDRKMKKFLGMGMTRVVATVPGDERWYEI